MIKANIPKNEKQRLEALYDYEIVDSEAEKVFDDLTTLASEICETPISLISLITPDRQWFKSKVGLDADETNREIAFCSHAILEDDVFEVSNALEDERFSDNPLVLSDPNIRFYAGAQLETPGGFKIGTLCVIDKKPKTLNEHQKVALKILSREVISQLELRIKNKRLIEMSERKTEYLSNISHELRTPLNAIVGLSELILMHEKIADVDAEIRSHVDHICFSSKNLLDIINAVLDISKIEANKMELNEENINLTDLLTNIITLLKHKAEQSGVTLNEHFNFESCTLINIDSQKLSQILINVITNAIKFSGAGKCVDVTAFLRNEQLCIEVKDQGIGISEADLKLLFNKFAQVGKASTSQEGTGLGLSITKGLVELMAGNISISSDEGVGTTVNITLPYLLEISSAPILKSRSINQVTLSQRKALIVEDNKVNQVVIVSMLEKLNMTYEILDDANNVLSKLKNNHVDIILMDINLPGISGVEAAKLLKSNHIDIPILALTADVFLSSEDKSVFNGFLSKPLQLELLEQALLRVFNQETQ
ncbi:hybrid sensor histidine kinase/response regulator [Pseudoalteromonas shioyasakiensis]|uniref:hybrid sensor histidine kinase/response regulator n=1 Tax=Pseudoalteromonas shioyasakiensis TaxID=1190813 RepID=UPI001C3C8DA6|nr:GAF domain-containing hybrid sensor histidine kinase/response regulator [Pseudoalteromonas shioyasakiensis]